MMFEELIVLIPSHSLEDFPTEATEDEATGLLNAFVCIWHPALIANAKVLPSWNASEYPPEELENRLVFVPKFCEQYLPGGWIAQAKNEGAKVVSGCLSRADYLAQALEGIDVPDTLDPELTADFLALGHCRLQMELLPRRMYHYIDLNEDVFQRESVSAAEHALDGDPEQAKVHLRGCFEALLNGRGQFYSDSLDCYLLELCLFLPEQADPHLRKLLTHPDPFNMLIVGEDLEKLANEHPDLITELKTRWDAGTLNLVGGERIEKPLPLVPLESWLWEFHRGLDLFRKHFGRLPKTWGRRRFGLNTLVPQVLTKFGYHSALHLVLDDGTYPEADEAKLSWEGCDGSQIPALPRFPLPADNATSYLKFSEIMAETMNHYQVAALLMAHWPEVRTIWLDDFRRMARYAPVLGKLATFDHFIEHSDDIPHPTQYQESDYFSPFLIHYVARQLDNPLSRFTGHFERRDRFETACWFRNMTRLLSGKPADESAYFDQEETVEAAGPDAEGDAVATAEQMLQNWEPACADELQQLVMNGAGDQPGYLILNPLSFTRTVTVSLPELQTPPAIGGMMKSVQADDTRKNVTLEIPGAGFAWVPQNSEASAESKRSKKKEPPTVEEGILRNEFFEVYINPATGGIARIKNYGRTPNRLSQQIAYRFQQERSWRVGEGEEAHVEASYYSEMRGLDMQVTCDGPGLAEVVTTGEILDQMNNSHLAMFTQTVRVWRGRPVVEIEIELQTQTVPDSNPWTNYYATRFAWNDMTAAQTRSVFLGAHGFRGERIESPHYFEIADADERTTILTHGQSFHRKTGVRMLDSLMIVAGETRRTFKYTIAVDQAYPMMAARDAEVPVTVLPTTSGPPRMGNQGWFFHLNAKNVQITKLLDLMNDSDWKTDDPENPPVPTSGFAVRLVETEGRKRSVKLRSFCTPTYARQRDFLGDTIATLRVQEDAVLVEMAPYEIADIELRY